jgi:hypothetical protein
MRKDIPIYELDEVGLALIPEDDSKLGRLWVAHLVNLKDYPLKNVLVSVEGKGRLNGAERKTSVLRYLLPEVPALGSSQIEVLLPDVMKINNYFWVSFSHENYMFDKKFLVPEDAAEVMELQGIPVLHQEGLWFD